jgi:hypothetical protein
MVYRPDGTESEHADALPLGGMPDGVPERLDLAARLIEAGVPDEVAVRRALSDFEIRTADVSTTAKLSTAGRTSNEDGGSVLEGLDADTIPSDEVSRAQGEILSERESQEPRLTKVHRNQIERAYRNLVEGWRQSGRTQAADNLERFLDGTGEPLRFSRDEAREFRPIKAAEAENERRFENGTFLGKTKNDKLNEKLTSLKEGETSELEDHWVYRYGPVGSAKNLVGGEADFYFAFGQTYVTSKARFEATRRGHTIYIEGEVSHSWDDKYDFEEDQPGGAGALMLQEHRGAAPFQFGARWRRKVSGTVDIRDGRLTHPKFQWTDVDD